MIFLAGSICCQVRQEEFSRIRKAAARFASDSDVLIVIGIGGSYLGARAAIELLTHSFQNLLTKRQRKAPIVIFAGTVSAQHILRIYLSF